MAAQGKRFPSAGAGREKKRPARRMERVGISSRKKRFLEIFFCLLYIMYKNEGPFVGGSYTCQAGNFHLYYC